MLVEDGGGGPKIVTIQVRGGRGRPGGRAGTAERVAKMLGKDGEGATKLVTIQVRGARSRRDARLAARSVANSLLVKTAINGQDPNWGRVMLALGKSAAAVRDERGRL